MKCPLALLLMASGALAHAQPVYRCEGSSGEVALQDRPCAAQQNHQQPNHQQRLLAKADVPAAALHLRTLLKPANDRRETQYAENRRRCEHAIRIVSLCGRPAGKFSCDEQGFRLEPVVKTSTRPLRVNGSAFKIWHCAQRAKQGGP